MLLPVASALVISFLLYLSIGLYYRKGVKQLGDIIPLIHGTQAKVANANEFAATTTAATISLATVIIAFFELVPVLGWWLLWPAITTGLGLAFFGLITKRIWEKMTAFDHRPSLHEFLGVEFGSRSVAIVGALCTTLGYLSMFAVELTVGSRFLAGLMHNVPEWITVVLIAVVAFAYLSIGGFRTAIVTDRLMMIFIWILLGALIAYYGLFVSNAGGFANAFATIPAPLKTITWNSGLLSFFWGILIMNLFTYVSNMGLWQRIAGSQVPETVVSGMWGSVIQTLISWSLFVVVAVGAFMIVTPVPGQNLLTTLLVSISGSLAGKLTIFCVTLGLLGAQLSTASTQLIATTHTIYEDLVAPYRKIALNARLVSGKEITLSRYIIVLSAIAAVGIVELLRWIGFGVADMAFAVYGAALGLVPAVLAALYLKRVELSAMKIFANISIAVGFTSGWSAALYGKLAGDQTLVFWAPVLSFCISGVFILLGMVYAHYLRDTKSLPAT